MNGMKMTSCIRRAALVVAALGLLACSSSDVRNETVALVNGDPIKAGELREFLGYRGGATPAANVPAERKKEALDRLIAGRLLAQEARTRGLDNTEEFRAAVRDNEPDILISALFSRELSKLKVGETEIRNEAKKLRAADNTLSGKDADARAARAVFERKARGIEEELIASAKKATPGSVDQAAVERIVKGEKVPDDAVLATVGSEKISYGAVRRVLAGATAGQHGGQDLSRNPVAIGRVLDREVTGKALAAYAGKEGIAGSEWMAAARSNLERSILVSLLAEKVIFPKDAVTDKEVEAAYAEHAATFVRDGKKIPLKEVREKIRAYLGNEARRKAIEAYIADLRKKAKITINEGPLSKV